jgi:hypothetical protein
MLALLADLVVGLLIYRLVRTSFCRPVALVASLFYAVSYVAVTACGYGLETQVFEALLVASILMVARKRYEAAAVTTALSIWTRPEGVLLAGILGVVAIWRTFRGHHHFPWRALAVLVVLTASWFGFAALYFGSPLPNSALAKLVQRSISADQWLEFFFTRNPVVMLLWLAAAIGVLSGIQRRSLATLILGIWAVVYTFFFLVSRPPFLGGWYFPPTALPLAALAGVGSAHVLGALLKRPARGAVAAAALIVLLDVVVIPRSLVTVRWHRHVVDTVYKPVGHWLGEHTRPAETIHASDIGYAGYLSGRRIQDAAALVTPEVWRYYSRHRDDRNWDVNFVMQVRPDVVILPIKGRIAARFFEGGFTDAYDPVQRFQVEGRTELYPDPDITDHYDRDGRNMADFIVYRKRP